MGFFDDLLKRLARFALATSPKRKTGQQDQITHPRRYLRFAIRASFLFIAKRDHRIDFHRPARRNETRRRTPRRRAIR